MGDVARFDSPDIHYHYPPQSKKLGLLAKAAIGAALAGTGAGGAIAMPYVLDALKKGGAPPPVVVPGEIRDWKLGQPVVE